MQTNPPAYAGGTDFLPPEGGTQNFKIKKHVVRKQRAKFLTITLPNYLLVLVVVELVLVVVVLLPLLLVVVLVLLLFVVLLVTFAGVEAGVVAAGVAVFAGLLALLGALLLFAAGSGQAAPNKPNVKTAERAITFFISIKFSCLLQRMYVYLFV